MKPPPLIVLHGGPSVPSHYLLPLVNVVTDRAVVFYDQLGCGRSSRPQDKDAYSIPLAVDDLSLLIKEWNLSSYHLYGHSFGGILAFEYLKRTRDANCRSVILSSVPTSIPQLEAESQRLLHEISEDFDGDKRQALERFRQLHECQAVPIPLSLLDAYAQAGSTWRGTQAIPDYTALVETNCKLEQPAFLLRGQDDFVTQPCMQDWDKCFKKTQTMVLAGCSHHGLLENEQLYGDVISSFLTDNDDTYM
jgi:pimeloyl-ACP methyl ester carboxylesterase